MNQFINITMAEHENRWETWKHNEHHVISNTQTQGYPNPGVGNRCVSVFLRCCLNCYACKKCGVRKWFINRASAFVLGAEPARVIDKPDHVLCAKNVSGAQAKFCSKKN